MAEPTREQMEAMLALHGWEPVQPPTTGRSSTTPRRYVLFSAERNQYLRMSIVKRYFQALDDDPELHCALATADPGFKDQAVSVRWQDIVDSDLRLMYVRWMARVLGMAIGPISEADAHAFFAAGYGHG